ncbi:hypothetical protein FSP39_005607 [Pinctada imbricata]|uniref:SOCS box domain-containing protein n=1 Tax=Pinctada imbricata TaxID=66713 RepID=A0AA88XZC5_PINIB|nr:hypothetical protein FSP39_005607 [Pinctada imbricata]
MESEERLPVSLIKKHKNTCQIKELGLEKTLEKELVDAAKRGDFCMVKELLEFGICPDAKEYNKCLFYESKNYTTPLQIAATNGSSDIVNFLIEYGASVNASDRFDVSALHMAAENGNLSCLSQLLEAEANCNIGTKYSKHGSYTAFPHPGGTTPLHLAASNNHVDCVTELIWHGADYNAVDEYGRTSLYIAAQKALEQCVHAHLKNAIWKDILSLPAKETGDTPLHECVKNGMLTCIHALLNCGSDVNHKNLAGFSPLHMAVRAGQTFSMDILRELVTNGYNTDVNIPESLGFTPLHYVCFHENNMQERRPEAAALLIAHGAKYTIQNRQGDNVLQYELRTNTRDMTILYAITKSVATLPSVESLGIAPPSNSELLLSQAQNFLAQGRSFQNAQDRNAFQRSLFKFIKSDVQYHKMMWYKELIKGPRSLQHYCRCVVRDALGVQRLGKINTLPLPTTLKEYLQLQLEEDPCVFPESSEEQP